MDNDLVANGKLEQIMTNPWARALLQLIPCGFGSAADVLVSHKYDDIRRNRLIYLLEQVNKGEFHLTEEIISSHDFLNCFFASAKAVMNTSRDEKIVLFANLFISYVEGSLNIDEHEEYLHLLDDLSAREILIMNILYDFECSVAHIPNDDELAHVNLYWNDYCLVLEKLGITNDLILPFHHRMTRTGLIKIIGATYLLERESDQRPATTPLFRRLHVFLNHR